HGVWSARALLSSWAVSSCRRCGISAMVPGVLPTYPPWQRHHSYTPIAHTNQLKKEQVFLKTGDAVSHILPHSPVLHRIQEFPPFISRIYLMVFLPRLR